MKRLAILGLVLYLALTPLAYGSDERVVPRDPRQIVFPILVDSKLIVDFPGPRPVYKETWKVWDHKTRTIRYRTIVRLR